MAIKHLLEQAPPTSFRNMLILAFIACGSVVGTFYIGSSLYQDYKWNKIVQTALAASALTGSRPHIGNRCADKICVSEIAFITKNDELLTLKFATKGAKFRVICTRERGLAERCNDFNIDQDSAYRCFEVLVSENMNPFDKIASCADFK